MAETACAVRGRSARRDHSRRLGVRLRAAGAARTCRGIPSNVPAQPVVSEQRRALTDVRPDLRRVAV